MLPVPVDETLILRDFAEEVEAEAVILSAAEWQGETYILLELTEEEEPDDGIFSDEPGEEEESACILRLTAERTADSLFLLKKADGSVVGFAGEGKPDCYDQVAERLLGD